MGPTLSSAPNDIDSAMLSAFLPDLGIATQALIRSAYGVLMTATLLQALPEAKRFFLSERWGGYAKSQSDVDLIQNPFVMPVLLTLWIAAAGSIAAGWWMPWAAIVNFILCRYFFIHMRWKGVLRGMGAPGFIAYWLGAVVTLLEVTRRFAPSVVPMALLVAQVDFAFLMFSAGFYKLSAGTNYPRVLRIRADHESGNILHEQQRRLMSVAGLNEVSHLFSGFGVDNSTEARGLAGHAHHTAMIRNHANLNS